MPDWCNPADYHFPHDLPDYYWAWEFLRRNPDYRKDWESALSRFLKGTVITRRSRDPDTPDFYLPVAEKEKWSLGWGLVNPNTDRPSYLSLAISYATVNFVTGNKVQLVPNGLRYPWAVFDLELPLKPQVARVLKILQDYQAVHMKDLHKVKPRRIKHHPNLWPDYLRLLDADLDGRTLKQIATALEEEEDGIDEKKVWDRLKAAKKLTKPPGYLDIVLSPPRTPK